MFKNNVFPAVAECRSVRAMDIRNVLFSLVLAGPTICLACDSGDDSGTETNTTAGPNTTGETDDTSGTEATTDAETETETGTESETGNQSACAIDGDPIFSGSGEGSATINGPFLEVLWAADSIACGSDCSVEPYLLLQIVEANRAPGNYQLGIDVKASVRTCDGTSTSIEDGMIEIVSSDASCFSAVISGASVFDGYDANGALWAATCG